MTPARTVFLIFLLVLPSVSGAQPWMEGFPAEANPGFYDIQRAFNTWWEGRDHTEKGKGWKAFKRWEWFWEQRVHPSGAFPDPMVLFRESERVASRRSTEAGGFWTPLGPDQSGGGYAGLGRLNCVRVHPATPQTIWVGSASGGLWKSTNGGSSWSGLTDDLPTLGVTDIVIDAASPSVMYIATGDGDAGDTYSIGVMKSTNGGTSWTTTGLNWTITQTRRISRLLQHPANGQILLAAASNGIHKTTNGGTSWSQVSTTTNFRDMEFKPGDPAVLYASRSNGQVFRSTNTGDSWTLLSSGIPTTGGRVALGVSPANPNIVYALFSNTSSGFGGLYRSTDAGVSWTLRSSSPNLLGWEPDGSDAGGQGWYDLAVAVSQTNADMLFTGGVNNWRSTDGGVTWSIISMWYGGAGPPAVHADQHDLWFVPGTATLYAANDGGLYRTTNNGGTWTWLGNGLQITQFYKIGTAQTNPAVVIAGAQDNGTKALGASGWRDVIGGDGMECAVDYSNASVMYGTLYYGDLFRSTNGGSSFFRISTGISETGGWVTPFILHPTQPSTIIAGYRNVWLSTNAGGSWSAISNFTSGTLDVVAAAPSNPAVLYVTDGSSIWRTTDGGASGWTKLTSPGSNAITAMEVHPQNPNTLWVTVSGYSAGLKVYRSTTGGSAWTNISGSLPNVPANTIVYEKNSPGRLYVGTDIGVFVRDSLQTDWQDFSTGLPNVVVSELEIQYSAGKLRAGTYGRGVWESPLAQTPGPTVTASADSFSIVLAPGDSAAFSVVLGNTGGLPLVWTALPSVPAWISCTPSGGTLAPSLQQTLTIRLRAVGNDGDVQAGLLTIASNDSATGPLTIALQVDVEEPIRVASVPAAPGWNLLSVPLRVTDYSRNALFPGAVSQAFAYHGAGYTPTDTLTHLGGYWLKFPAAALQPVAGYFVATDSVSVRPGWNLVGTVSRPLHPAAVGATGASVVSDFFTFGARGFTAADSLRPGRAYWVKISGSGTLRLPAVPPGPGAPRR